MYSRRILALIVTAIIALALVGCARTTPEVLVQPAPAPTPAPTAAPAPTAQPTLLPKAQPVPTAIPADTTFNLPDSQSEQDELEVAMTVQAWIQAIETGNSDMASYLYGLEAGASRSEILDHIEALRLFVTDGTDPNKANFGAYLGFYDIIGSYPTSPDHRVAIALMRFERTTICFQGELARFDDMSWSVERWEPITWADCRPEIARLPDWVREDWRATLHIP